MALASALAGASSFGLTGVGATMAGSPFVEVTRQALWSGLGCGSAALGCACICAFFFGMAYGDVS